MKTIINAKNALSLLFLIPILTSAISFAMPNDINYKIPTATYLCCYLISGLSCFYLAHNKNEFIKSKTHKVSMYLLALYYIICDGLLIRFLSLISENYQIFNIVKNICADQSNQVMYTTLILAFFGLICTIAFLMFFWNIPAKKSTKLLLTLLFFVPETINGIIPYLDNLMEYRFLLRQTLDIACNGLMLYLILKAYKTKINID
ncbi:MAG: hypothetical protein IKV26_01030 [Paludibacteraceae bacterium]|nr:hypothetical protein [Paludibacteraceae bacterium]